MSEERSVKRRSIGDYRRSGDWTDYWSTKIGSATDGKILVRGYPVEEIIENCSFIEATWLIIKGELPNSSQAKMFEAVLMSGMDQQFISSEVCAGRYVASAAPENPVAAVAAGMLATGTVTGSPADAVAMIYRAYDISQKEGLDLQETAIRVVDSYLSEGKLIPGIGHPVHTRFDPRAEALRRVVTRIGGWGKKASLFDAIHSEFIRRRDSFLPQNLAGVAACVYAELGFTPIEISALNGLGYTVTMVAHVVEEIKEGVPLRIIPEALGAKYVGPPERHIAKQSG